MSIYKQIWYRLMAKQLSKPQGILASLTGRKMNTNNKAQYELMLDTMKPNHEDHILEIGFGNGKFFPDLYAKANQLQITGIDISHEMVTQAVKNNMELFEKGAMKVKVGNSDDLPFEDHSFDIIYCINVIYFWENPETHLREIFRVLKPGGLFYTGFRPEETMRELPFTKYGFQLYTEDEWSHILKENGFTVLDIRKLSETKSFSSANTSPRDGICISAKKQFETGFVKTVREPEAVL